MLKVRVDVTGGVEEIARALAAGSDIVIEKAKATLSLMADRVISLAGPLVPVAQDGGQLKASLRKGRATYLESRAVVSVAVIAGGSPLDSFLADTHHKYNIYAALQEMDIGRGAPFQHATGRAHFILGPVEMVAPSIPDEVLAAIHPEDLGGA